MFRFYPHFVTKGSVEKNFLKHFRFEPRFVTKGSVEKLQTHLAKCIAKRPPKLCNHLKINYFQKKWLKMPFPLPTEWGDFFSTVKSHMESSLELYIPLKMMNFQKWLLKNTFPLATYWEIPLVYLDNWIPSNRICARGSTRRYERANGCNTPLPPAGRVGCSAFPI